MAVIFQSQLTSAPISGQSSTATSASKKKSDIKQNPNFLNSRILAPGLTSNKEDPRQDNQLITNLSTASSSFKSLLFFYYMNPAIYCFKYSMTLSVHPHHVILKHGNAGLIKVSYFFLCKSVLHNRS